MYVFFNCAKSWRFRTVPKSSSEKWRRKLHIKFRRFRLNIRTSVIRNDFLLSRFILAAAFVLEEITLSSELCFPKIGKSFSLSIIVDSVQEWMGIKKHLEKAVILLLWRTFQFTSTVFCSTGLRILERLFFSFPDVDSKVYRVYR